MTDLVTGDWMRILFLMLLLVFIGGGILMETAGRRNQALRQLATWAMIFGVVAAGAAWWQERQSTPRFSSDGQRIEVPMASDGHFHLRAEVNGTEISFLIDTGASSLVLSPADARAAGLDTERLDFRDTAMTANGPVSSAPVRLESVTIGPVTDHNVPADVNGADMGVSLMGMSFLSNFARVGIEGNRLILER